MFPIRTLTTTLAILTENFSDFPQSVQGNFGISPQLGHDYFLANPFQFFIFSIILTVTPRNAGQDVATQPTNKIPEPATTL